MAGERKRKSQKGRGNHKWEGETKKKADPGNTGKKKSDEKRFKREITKTQHHAGWE